MIKRIVVAGGRDFADYETAKTFIDQCLSDISDKYNIIFISGGCKGADALGERYAKEKGYLIERYLAEWKRYGRSAGPIRNKKMADVCDFVICFWDGKSRGTKSMIEYAESLGKPIAIKQYKNKESQWVPFWEV